MIEIKNLTKKFNIGKPNEATVLNSISLTVEDGDFVAIMGRSGAGKSTLLHIMALLDKQTEGEYILNGTNTFKMSDSQSSVCRNKNIGILLQDFRLIETDTVLENVMTPLYFSKVPFTSMKKYARAALAKVGISSLEKQVARTLSGGEKQRVGLARAIINSPSILLADEPTGALDNTNRDALMNLITEINKDGTTVIIVTHDNYVAERCKRKIVLNDGKAE